MKKIKLNIALIATVLGLGAAFGFKTSEVKHSQTNFFWYSVQDAGGYSWQSTEPQGASCQAGSATCEIETTIAGTPPANGYPSSYTPVMGSDKHSVLVVN